MHETDAATISGSEFEGNLVNFGSGGGGALSGHSSVVSVSTSTFSENLSEGRGGALYAVDSQMDLSGVELHTNEAIGEGGAWYQLGGWSSCSNCELSRNTSTDDGGAIWSTAEDLALTESDVTWNETSGGNGGGVFFEGDRLLIEDVMFARNSGLSGGAVFAASQEIFSSEFTVYQENESIFSGVDPGPRHPDAVVVVQNNDLLAERCRRWGGTVMIAIDGADVRNNPVAFGQQVQASVLAATSAGPSWRTTTSTRTRRQLPGRRRPHRRGRQPLRRSAALDLASTKLHQRQPLSQVEVAGRGR